MTRVPTVQQGGRLMALSSGNIALAPGRGDWGPLLRRGWVETIDEDDKDKRYLPPVRITPDGLRALAAAMEKHPELTPEIKPTDYPQLDKSPAIAQLEEKVRKYRDDAAEERAQRVRLQMKLRSVKREVEHFDV